MGSKKSNSVKKFFKLFISDFKISPHLIPYKKHHFGDFSNNNIDINTAKKSQYILKYKIKSSKKGFSLLIKLYQHPLKQDTLKKVILFIL